MLDELAGVPVAGTGILLLIVGQESIPVSLNLTGGLVLEMIKESFHADVFGGTTHFTGLCGVVVGDLDAIGVVADYYDIAHSHDLAG